MARTYLHNGALSPYPFTDADPVGLPFPYSCVYAIGVCAVPYFGEGTNIVATGIELDTEAVAVSLEWRSQDGSRHMPMCTLSARTGGYGTASSASSYTAWICAGAVPRSARGSFRGEWALDPACVNFMSAEDVSGSPAADGEVQLDSAEAVSIYADGLLSAFVPQDTASVAGISLPAGTVPVLLYADIPEGTATVARGADDTGYQIATSVDRMAPTTDGIFRLSSASPSGDESSSASDYVSFTVFRDPVRGRSYAPLYSEMLAAGDDENALAERNKLIGGSVILTIDGHHAIPNCYGDDDEAKR